MSHDSAFQILPDSLRGIRQQQLTVVEFCQIWRAQNSLLTALPPRYTQVLEDLLGRLEASSLFTEESCSFSQIDLLANLDIWLDKARLALSQST